MNRAIISALAAITLAAIRLTASETVDEKEAIRKAALDYIEGWYEGNAERMERALYTELAKRAIFKAAGTEKFVNLTKAQMVEATQKGGGKARPSDTRNIKVEILDVYKDIANVRTESADFVDYLQLAKTEGKWKIVNVLWQNYAKDRKEVALDPKVLAAYVGEYELKPGFVIAVTMEENRLFAQATGQPKVEIYPESDTQFFLKIVEAQITFVRDPEGKVTQLVLQQGGANAQAKKIK